VEKHYQLSDLEFEAQFQSLTFDPADFSHEAHLRLAWIHVRKYGIDKALQNVSAQILAFTMFLGAEGKFNKTLTIAAVRTVFHFMLKSKAASFHEFIQEFPRLKHHFKELIESHYGFDIFNSEKAKSTYLEPDLQPFD